jgi:hypothetical protein
MANKLYSVALHYQVWIDVEANSEDEALECAKNAKFELNLKQLEGNEPNITIVSVEYNDLEPLIYEYPD